MAVDTAYLTVDGSGCCSCALSRAVHRCHVAAVLQHSDNTKCIVPLTRTQLQLAVLSQGQHFERRVHVVTPDTSLHQRTECHHGGFNA